MIQSICLNTPELAVRGKFHLIFSRDADISSCSWHRESNLIMVGVTDIV